MAIVKSAISEINEQKSQAEILKALVNRASSFAPRVAFFVIKGEQASGWRGRGFEGSVGDDAIQEISFSVNADTVVGSAAKQLATWSGGPGSHSEDHLILKPPWRRDGATNRGDTAEVRGRAVAVLYADSAGLDSESINLEALETPRHRFGNGRRALVSRAWAQPLRNEQSKKRPRLSSNRSRRTSQRVNTLQSRNRRVTPEPSFSGAETIENYQPAYEETPSYEQAPAEPGVVRRGCAG
jgi:hypothetical protein